MNHLKRYFAYRRSQRLRKSPLRRYCEDAVTVVAIAWVALTAFPSLLFAHSEAIGQITFYADEPLPKEIRTVSERAVERLQTTPTFKPTDMLHVFIANSLWRRVILIPASLNAYGAANIWTGNIVLGRCDIKNDVAYNARPKWNERPLHEVIAHECTHVLLQRRVGFVRYLSIPTWKNEGYCECIAGGGSFDRTLGETMLASGKDDNSPAFRYLKFSMAVSAVLQQCKADHVECLGQPATFEAALESAIQKLKKGEPGVGADSR